MTGLKAYLCMETYENTGGVIFAKSNLEARKWAANEYNGGELGGLSIHRAHNLDKYGVVHKIPVEEMIALGWWFECYWSGIRMDESLYSGERDFYNQETKQWEEDKFFIDKEPVGFMNRPVFACKEYADEYYQYKHIEKDFHEEQLKYYRSLVLTRFPDAVLINKKNSFGSEEYISSVDSVTGSFQGLNSRIVTHVKIPFEFPGMKHWAHLEYRAPEYSKIGPSRIMFYCANGDLEAFQVWDTAEKDKI